MILCFLSRSFARFSNLTLNESLFVAAIFNITLRCFRLSCEICFPLRFCYDKKRSWLARRRKNRKFVENSKDCDLKTFFEFFDLLFFFFVCAEKANVETKRADEELEEDIKDCLSSSWLLVYKKYQISLTTTTANSRTSANEVIFILNEWRSHQIWVWTSSQMGGKVLNNRPRVAVGPRAP